MRNIARWAVGACLVAASGCAVIAEEDGNDIWRTGAEVVAEGGTEEGGDEGIPEGGAGIVDSSQQALLRLDFLYVHGVKGCQNHRLNAEGSLDELEAALTAELPAWIAAYEAAHPGVTVVTNSVHANLYTATPSPHHPSDSSDPLNMDDWEVGDPGCATSRQGDPCTTAFEWRYRLAQEIQQHFPPDARNIILVGHSTGARAAFEVAANVGAGGVGTHDWGVQDRIAGVISIQGMVDSLGTSKYNALGPTSFETSCKYGDPIVGFGDSCSLGNGWCEYAGDVSGFSAADWVAQNKHALMLTSYASCSPSLFTGFTDGPLPFDAQGSTKAVGTSMTAAPGKTFRPAHGIKYGSFCHSAIVDPSLSGHAAAVSAARSRILDWLFASAPRVAASGTIEASSISYNQSTPTYSIGGACPAGHADGGVHVAGRCKHPGYFDGGDHAIASSEISTGNGATCNGTFSWRQAHDRNNKHAATFWWKTYSLPSGGGVVDALLPD